MNTPGSRSPCAVSRATTLYLCLALVVTFFLFAPQQAHAATGTGGSLPYETWLEALRNSVTGQ